MSLKIEFLNAIDYPKVREFINSEWSKGHILAVSKELFDWQYLNKNGSYNFVVLKKNNYISGVLGFIPSRRYDESLMEDNIIWLALWKISEKIKLQGIGLKMISFLKKEIDHTGIAVNGINIKISSLYKSLGYTTSNLNHYYTTNINSDTKLISSPEDYQHPYVKSKGLDWKMLNENDLKKLQQNYRNKIRSNSAIKKSPHYFLNRYLKHPFYKYQVYLILSNEIDEEALISIRIDRKNNSNVLRIVDYYGNNKILNDAGKGLQKIMNQNKIEYADFFSFGIPSNIMDNLGFKIVDKEKHVVVPNYFEPFVNKNTEILFAYKNLKISNEDYIICKGDGDQDRPNKF